MRILVAGFAIAIGLAAPAAAQDPIAVETDADWRHRHTSIAIPPMVGEFERRGVVQYSQDEFNVSVALKADNGATTATIYIFRSGEPSLSIWADRATSAMLSSGQLGKPDLDAAIIGTLTPPNGAGVDSGYKLIVPVADDRFRSTGLALFAHDDWLVKIRMTSAAMDAAELDARIDSLVAGLSTGQSRRRYGTFASVEDCVEPLRIKKRAKRAQLDMMGSIMFGTIVAAASEKKPEKTAEGQDDPASVWCRDAASRNEFGVYRTESMGDDYLMAFGDAGVTAVTGRIDAVGLMKPSRLFTVSVSDGVKEEVFPPFTRTPQPEQVYAMMGRVSPVTTIDVRPGGDGGTSITVPAGSSD